MLLRARDGLDLLRVRSAPCWRVDAQLLHVVRDLGRLRRGEKRVRLLRRDGRLSLHGRQHRGVRPPVDDGAEITHFRADRAALEAHAGEQRRLQLAVVRRADGFHVLPRGLAGLVQRMLRLRLAVLGVLVLRFLRRGLRRALHVLERRARVNEGGVLDHPRDRHLRRHVPAGGAEGHELAAEAEGDSGGPAEVARRPAAGRLGRADVVELQSPVEGRGRDDARQSRRPPREVPPPRGVGVAKRARRAKCRGTRGGSEQPRRSRLLPRGLCRAGRRLTGLGRRRRRLAAQLVNGLG
mmetsp:Transcript_5462/g.21595  ORF Transcript_5462/g.21595 Transcript_5462/m.21595 type:complete len:295 (-) Transcript_5462:678-1562(-)